MLKHNKNFLKAGVFLKKEAQAAEKQFEALTKELGDVANMLKLSKEAADKQLKDLATNFDGVKADGADLKKTVEKHTADYAEMIAKTQALTEGLDSIKKELDKPLIRGGGDLEKKDRDDAVELQRRIFSSKNAGNDIGFKADLNNLVIAADYRSAMQKMSMAGVNSISDIKRSFSAAETKAFEASTVDGAFFMPEMLGMEVDCNIECAYLLDLYQQITLTRRTFMYPQVEDYASIGNFTCDAACDVEQGPDGNITYKNGQVFSWRGMFCMQKAVIQEANYDFFGFMIRSAQRSLRINHNRVMISGDGVNEPKGWATSDCFPKLKTAALAFDHQMFRRFLSTAPVEYGDVVATMHQNVFAYLASAVDSNGRFIFGDGNMLFSPSEASARIRISNCLPDATVNNTKGSAAAPFVAGDFLVAAGNWNKAFTHAMRKPLGFELYVGGSSKWCSKWQFDAEMAGFVTCCPAARTLVVGA